MKPTIQCCLCVVLVIIPCYSTSNVFYTSSSDYSTTLIDAFDAVFPYQSSVVKLYSGSHLVSAEPLCFDLPVDPTLSLNILFLFSWISDVQTPLIDLTDPDGVSQIILEDLDNSNIASYRCLDNCSTGIFTICMSSNSGSLIVALTARAEPAAGQDDPIEIGTTLIGVNGELSNHDFSAGGPDSVVKLTVSLTSNGYEPVLDAKIKARYRNPSGNKQFEVWLIDTGLVMDVQPRDGIYTGYIANTEEMGKHAVSILVHGDNETKIEMTLQRTQSPGSTFAFIAGIDFSYSAEIPVNYTFIRYKLLGYFEATSLRTSDTLPPTEIRDLRLGSADSNVWTITFTAVGDDFDNGKASSYKISWSNGNYNLANGVNVTVITPDDVVELGKLTSPQDPGTEETMSIFFGNYTGLVTLIVQAVDDAGNIGKRHFPMSRVVSETKYTSIDQLRSPGDRVTNIVHGGMSGSTTRSYSLGSQTGSARDNTGVSTQSPTSLTTSSTNPTMLVPTIAATSNMTLRPTTTPRVTVPSTKGTNNKSNKLLVTYYTNLILVLSVGLIPIFVL